MATKKSAGKGARSGSKAAQGSGPTQFSVGEGRLTVKVPQTTMEFGAPGSALQTFFARTDQDSSPGWNVLTIRGLTPNTRVITVWMTEWSAGNFSHAGAAWFYTYSVQLYNQGRNCRVRYYLDWGSHLPTGAQVVYGPG
ncbi:MAG TPA: hypothetical protein VGW12_20615 [Pyrinomonadaceae bacterium]|nr:hypothetical protein [Pyrinomonadaceae bacterium]